MLSDSFTVSIELTPRPVRQLDVDPITGAEWVDTFLCGGMLKVYRLARLVSVDFNTPQRIWSVRSGAVIVAVSERDSCAEFFKHPIASDHIKQWLAKRLIFVSDDIPLFIDVESSEPVLATFTFIRMHPCPMPSSKSVTSLPKKAPFLTSIVSELHS